MDEVVRAAHLLADGVVDPTYARRLSLDDVPAYHDVLRAGDVHGMGILDPR